MKTPEGGPGSDYRGASEGEGLGGTGPQVDNAPPQALVPAARLPFLALTVSFEDRRRIISLLTRSATPTVRRKLDWR
jgi:hypothetical protein